MLYFIGLSAFSTSEIAATNRPIMSRKPYLFHALLMSVLFCKLKLIRNHA